jgi:hypothetical protein
MTPPKRAKRSTFAVAAIAKSCREVFGVPPEANSNAGQIKTRKLVGGQKARWIKGPASANTEKPAIETSTRLRIRITNSYAK